MGSKAVYTFQAGGGFAFLLPETCLRVLSHLDSEDVARFRYVSRFIAELARSSQIGEPFWRNRFAPNKEIAFALGMFPPHRPGDIWIRRFFKVKHARAMQSRVVHTGWAQAIENRKRLWPSVCDIIEPLKAFIAQDPQQTILPPALASELTDGSVYGRMGDPFFCEP